MVRELIDPSHPFATMTHEERLAEANGRGKCPKPGTPGYTPEDASQRGEDAKLLIRAAVAAGADETARDALKAALDFMAGMKPESFNKHWKKAEQEKSRFDRRGRRRRRDRRQRRQAGRSAAARLPCRRRLDVQDRRGRQRQDDRYADLPPAEGGQPRPQREGRELGYAGRIRGSRRQIAPRGGADDAARRRAREALDMLTRAGLHLAGADKAIRQAVIDLIIKWMPAARITVSSKMGWVDGHKAFLFGNGTTIGDPSCLSAGWGGHAQRARHAADAARSRTGATASPRLPSAIR